MVSPGRIYVIVALILAVVLGLTFLIVRGSGPLSGPVLEGGKETDGIDSIRDGPRESPRRGPGSSSAAVEPAPPGVGDPGAAPRERPGGGADGSINGPEPDPGSQDFEYGPAAGEERVSAILVDEQGVPLPWTSVSVQTLSVPITVLTRGPVRTDRDGRFHFRPPSASNVLHVWCPGLRASAKQPWQPGVRDGAPLTIRPEGRALVGHLVNEAGEAPNWKGINLRLALVPSGDPGGGLDRFTPISVDRRTGSFAAIITNPDDQDLTVSVLGQTGVMELRRIPSVTRVPPPLVVVVPDPRSFFGAFSLRIINTKPEEDLASLEVVWNRKRVRMIHLSRDADDVWRTGPLARGAYLLRAVAGNRVSTWRRVELRPGTTPSLGVLTLEDRAMLRVQPLFPDGSVDRGAKIKLIEDVTGVPIPARFSGDSQGFLGLNLSPGRYRVGVTASDPRRGPTGATIAELHPGGVHEVVVRLESR